jgi:hypothetical protein
MATKTLEIEVVGVYYRVTQDTMDSLASDTPLHCKIEREPKNPHDPNAIKVIVTEKPYAKTHEGMHIGYVGRPTATVIAPELDDGTFPYTDAWLTSLDPESGRGELLLTRDKKGKPEA